MNNITANFNQILEFAEGYNLPLTKKRGILREYLQCKILDIICREKSSSDLIFVGGTCLRLLWDSDRFSEDLDFDLQNLNFSEVDNLMNRTHKKIENQNLSLDFYRNETSEKVFYEFRFKRLLSELNISKQPEGKLTIKFDFEDFWQNQERKVKILNRYGFLVNVVTVPLDHHLVQKITAYLRRKETLARDLYDIIWLISHKAEIDFNLVKQNSLPENLVERAIEKFEKERSELETLKQRLKPFLIREDYADKLSLFPQMLKQLL